ncbi:ABC transporter ATP-binding protein [Amaricoccus tamworthensis]|uniref:ABC transporter ATP-binding protein n=1 Tax=Amaricoccus tamworthensis TaxID=57002 RepID=UPI003C798DD8
MSPILKLSQVSAAYGPSQVLFGVDLEVESGQVVALMGRNGMGKTTTIRAICGLLPVLQGNVSFDGETVKGKKPYQIAQMGIGLVPEGRRCFSSLTVEENLLAVARPGPWKLEQIWGLFPRLLERRGQVARNLSGGEQQMLAISRALVTNPRLLVLDEATEGLAPVVRQEIWRAVVALKGNSGLSILIVDKSLRELSQVADSVILLENGRSVWNGTFEKLSAHLVEKYLGVGRVGVD